MDEKSPSLMPEFKKVTEVPLSSVTVSAFACGIAAKSSAAKTPKT
jgi:hypothetical protein